jgi:hypothetical protein
MTATEDRWTVDNDTRLRDPNGMRRLLLHSDADLFRSALDNEYARRALPDGVELHSDGSLWALGRNIPHDWERRYCDDGRWMRDGAVCFSGGMYEVRPPQEPPTVRVPWGTDLIGHTPAAAPPDDRWPIQAIWYDEDRGCCYGSHEARMDLDGWWGVSTDGTVEVLA